MAGEFVHLHVHTEYSLLDGACRIDKLMSRVKELGQDAVAITDHGAMFGVIDFYKAANAAGIKPIIGCEVYTAARTRFDKTYDLDNESNHLILLCKNNDGYKNLIKMVSYAYTEGFYNRPRVDMELIKKYSGGLIALSACIAGYVPRRLLSGDYKGAKEYALMMRDIFGEGNYYLELQNHSLPEQAQVNRGLVKISEETGIPLVITNDAHYLTSDDSFAQDVLMCIQTGKTVDEVDRMRLEPAEYYIKGTDEMRALFPNREDAIANTVKIASECNVTFDFSSYHLPQFPLPEGESDAYAYLHRLCSEGFLERYPNDPPELRKQLEFELSIISEMGFVDYFLITHDFIAYAKSKGIPVGPGRGSAVGSIVAYSLKITDIDPIKYRLYFERFLNPERISMPDIDIDFCPERRQEVIEYVTQKYGKDHVVQIITFGTMKARAVVRDVGRAMGFTYAECDAIAKAIPNDLKMTIEQALEVSPQLESMYSADERIKRMIDTSMLLEGMPRHSSTHAAGVVITGKPANEYVPLARNDDLIVTQFTMKTIEKLGLLKMDFLGLRNLTVISDAEKIIRLKEPDFDISKVSEDDRETFKMLSEGKTIGVFQVESSGMTSVCVGMKAQSIEEITALIALYRPGPMDSIPKYINNKVNQKDIKYAHPLLRNILDVTYGCIVYQEQVMEIFRILAGYSLGRADLVRRAMGKKDMGILVKERENFIYGNAEEGIKGCIANGVPEDVADKLFNEIKEFANYAFNKAHATAYAIVSYRTAYLKCHYPREYMAALLTSVLGDTAKVAEYTAACRDIGINVLPPDINSSYGGFTVVGNDIRFGLVALKNVGSAFIESLVEERENGGVFKSFQEFLERMYPRELNRRAVEAFIKCGAMDGFGYKRSQMLMMFDLIIDAISIKAKSVAEGQLGFFGDDEDNAEQDIIKAPDIAEFSYRELLIMEKETAGMYLSGHPMNEYREVLEKNGVTDIGKINAEYSVEGTDDEGLEEVVDKAKSFTDGQELLVAGVVESVKTKITKKGSPMAYVRIEDMTGSIELLCFSRVMTDNGGLFRVGTPVAVRGTLTVREDEEPKIIADAVSLASTPPAAKQRYRRDYSGEKSRAEEEAPAVNAEASKVGKIYLRLNEKNRINTDRVACLLRFLNGMTRVIFYNEETKQYSDAPPELCAELCPELIGELGELLGEENVVLR